MLDNLQPAWVITRREVRDTFRDWRIIFPIIVLTLVFPALMNFTARQAILFVEKYDAPLVAERMIPFLLMIVGFFPISVSLVIALESFVGEKERRSIEPLLCSPLSDSQIYLGKLLAAMIPPLAASYMGISVYLIGLYLQVGWTPKPILLIQILTLTTVQAVLMVSGAVVVSSQTTSVRAANLLASFIIIPMAFLIQGESIIMFWARYNILWWAILGQALIAGLLIRTGLAYFNREEMLGRELDVLNLRWAGKRVVQSFRGQARSILSWYRTELPATLLQLRLPIAVSAIGLMIGITAGVSLARDFPIPAELLSFNLLKNGFVEGLEMIKFYSAAGVGVVWFHNLRAVLIATLLGMFSFGVLGLLTLMLPMVIIGYISANIALAGNSPLPFLAALVLPHGIFEIPAILLASASILNLGATLTAPAHGKSLGEAWLVSLAKWSRMLVGLILPLFLLAAAVEVFVTPLVAVLILGK